MIPLLITSKDSKLIRDYVDKLKLNNLFFEISPSTKECKTSPKYFCSSFTNKSLSVPISLFFPNGFFPVGWKQSEHQILSLFVFQLLSG